MRLYTIQQPLVAQILTSQQKWHCDKQFAEPGFKDAYGWLENEMTKRGLPPEKVGGSPIWAWAQYDSAKKKRPDLRCTGHLPKGDKGVLIEIEKSDSEILLSDFSLWHYVLNKWYLPESMEKDNEEATEIEKVDSWVRIFDLSFCPEDISEPHEHKRLQATFWSIHPAEVVSVTNFVAR